MSEQSISSTQALSRSQDDRVLQEIPIGSLQNSVQRNVTGHIKRPIMKKKINFNGCEEDLENKQPNEVLDDGYLTPTAVKKNSWLFEVQKIDELEKFPYELQLEITKFLCPVDLIFRLQGLNKHWRKFSTSPAIWDMLDKIKPISIGDRLLKVQCLVERRSKGKLYIARDRITHQKLSLRKIFLDVTNAGQDDGLPTSVLREVTHLKLLEHPNIAKLTHAQVENEIVQLVYEYYDSNLKDYIKKEGYQVKPSALNQQKRRGESHYYALQQDQIKNILYQLLQAMTTCHRNGVMHRNLKPDNIMVTDNGVVKICDFSLSRIGTVPHIPYTPEDPKERERSGREARRLWYRPPELLFRKKFYSFEVDIWAVGCLLGEMCLGEPLFNGESEIEQLFKIFRLTGSPTTELVNRIKEGSEQDIINLPQWEKMPFSNVCAPPGSQKLLDIIKSYVPAREQSLVKLFEMKEIIGEVGLDLLNRLLELDPEDRISAEEALQHPFFNEIRTESNPYIDRSVIPRISNYKGDISLDHFPYLADQMHKVELRTSPQANFMANQPHITENMRSILVDWLVDVSVHFEVMSSTLHFAINYIDRTLSKVQIEKNKLQLVGVSCMKIADVFNERSKEYYRQENASEYAYITADEYTAQEVIQYEKKILTTINFDLYSPTSISFLKLYFQVLNPDPAVMTTACYLCDLMLLAMGSNQFRPSLLASSCLFVAFIALQQELPCAESGSPLHKCRRLFGHWFDAAEFEKCVNHVRISWTESRHNPNFSRFDAVNNKYEPQAEIVNIRQLQPPLVSSRLFDKWFYAPPQLGGPLSEDHEMMEIC